jgi:ATP-binding cassette, subfamily B, bacterial PglK
MINSIRQSLGFLSLRQRFVYFGLISLRAVSSVLDVVGIALVGLLAGLAATSLDASAPLVIMGFTLPAVNQQTMVLLVLVVLFVFAFKALLAIITIRFITAFLARVESQRAGEITRYLFSGNLDTVHARSKGEILWAVGGSASTAFSGILNSLATLISESILLILVLSTFFFVDAIATLFVFAYFGMIILVIQLVISKSLQRAGQDAAVGNVDSSTAVGDFVEAFREIVIFGKQDYFLKKFDVARFRMSKGTATMNFLAGMPRYVVETALMLGVVIFVGFQFLTGQLATGLVVVGVFLTGGVRIMASLLPLQNAAGNIKIQAEQGQLAFQVLRESRKSQSEHIPERISKDLPETVSDDNFGALNVVLDQVTFTYPGAEVKALSEISLEIQGGSHVAIIGPSGAGKTTLVDLILGLIEPSSGSVLIGKSLPRDILSTSPGSISYVPQKPGIISGTIAENVALGIPAEEIDEDGVISALRSANLADFVSDLPEGIHTSVGSQADALSGGQIQRLGLARALYEKPRLIVLDEATSALDASSEALITESLKKLGKNVTVIVIAHRLSTVQHSDNVFVMENGSITASGKFSYLRKNVPMVAEYVRLMSFEAE